MWMTSFKIVTSYTGDLNSITLVGTTWQPQENVGCGSRLSPYIQKCEAN